MPTTVHNSLNLKKNAFLDARLAPVATFASLPDPTVEANFIPEGAVIYVIDVKSNYQVQNVSGILSWVNIGGEVDALVVGAITLLPSSTNINLATVTPAIEKCHSVVVTISGTSANLQINTITNFPADQSITFYANPGNTIKFTHTDYDAGASDNIVLEDGFDFVLQGRLDGNESLTLRKEDTKVVQKSAVQYIKKSEIQQLINLAASIVIVDNVTTADATKALSANQGKVLKDLIDTKMVAFNLGSHIYASGAGPTYALNASPFRFKAVSLDQSSIALAAAAQELIGVDNDFYRVYYSRAEGTFILPPKDNPALVNWIQIAAGQDELLHAKVDLYYDAGLSAVATNTYYFYVSMPTWLGDTANLLRGTNTDGTATEKLNIALEPGTYSIKVKVNLQTTSPEDLTLSLLLTDAVGTIGSPEGSGAAVYDNGFVSTAFAGGTDQIFFAETIERVNIGSKNVIVLKLQTANADFTGVDMLGPQSKLTGHLEILKIRRYVAPVFPTT